MLGAATRAGLTGLSVRLEQLPTEGNNWKAVCEATATFTDGRTFTDVGGANVQNVGRMIGPHIIRMASTRAKARCLRDAINVGVAALEEMGDDDDQTQHTAHSTPATPRVVSVLEGVPATRPHPVHATTAGDLATTEQMARLAKLQAALHRPATVEPDITQDAAAVQIAELAAQLNARNGNARHG